MNNVNLTGRATKDPELKYTPTGKAVTTVTIAVNRPFLKDGKQEADFIPVVVWGKRAEFVATYIGKGKLFEVSGRLQVRSYDAKDGSKRYVTEVIAESVDPIEWVKPEKTEMQEVYEGDIPF